MSFSAYIVYPSVLSLNNLKHPKLEADKNIFEHEKLMLRLTFNPGLALTGFRTTRPWYTSNEDCKLSTDLYFREVP